MPKRPNYDPNQPYALEITPDILPIVYGLIPAWAEVDPKNLRNKMIVFGHPKPGKVAIFDMRDFADYFDHIENVKPVMIRKFIKK